MKVLTMLYLFMFGLIGTVVVICFILFGDVIDKLERTCNEYDMNYEYREGANCLDKQNVLHPISYDCGTFRWEGCKIRFIELGD